MKRRVDSKEEEEEEQEQEEKGPELLQKYPTFCVPPSLFNNPIEDEGEVEARGRFGPKRGDAKARYTYREDGSCYIRIDDANNLEFWCQVVIPPKKEK